MTCCHCGDVLDFPTSCFAFQAILSTEHEERRLHKPDEKTVRTFDSSLQWHQILLSCFSLESSAGGPAQFRQIAPFSGEEMDETAALIQSLHHHHHFNSAVLPELPTERPKWFFSAGSLFPFSPFSRLKSVCSPESGPRVAPPRLTLTG